MACPPRAAHSPSDHQQEPLREKEKGITRRVAGHLQLLHLLRTNIAEGSREPDNAMGNLEETDQERVSTGRSPGAHRFAIGVLRGASKRALPTSFFCLRKLFLPERVIAIGALEQLSQFRLIGQRSWPRERRHQQCATKTRRVRTAWRAYREPWCVSSFPS